MPVACRSPLSTAIFHRARWEGAAASSFFSWASVARTGSIRRRYTASSLSTGMTSRRLGGSSVSTSRLVRLSMRPSSRSFSPSSSGLATI